MKHKPYQRSLILAITPFYRVLIVLVSGTRKWEWSWQHRRRGVIRAGSEMKSKLVEWQVEDEAAEMLALDQIEELERRGYRRAWQRYEGGRVVWKLSPPGVYQPEEGERLVDIDPP